MKACPRLALMSGRLLLGALDGAVPGQPDDGTAPPDPVTGLHLPKVPPGLVPVFNDAGLAALERVCAGRSFAQRRGTAIIVVFRGSASGMLSWSASGMARTAPRRAASA